MAYTHNAGFELEDWHPGGLRWFPAIASHNDADTSEPMRVVRLPGPHFDEALAAKRAAERWLAECRAWSDAKRRALNDAAPAMLAALEALLQVRDNEPDAALLEDKALWNDARVAVAAAKGGA